MATTYTSADATYVKDPLTTIFTPADWCSSRLYTLTDDGIGNAVAQRDIAIINTEDYGGIGRAAECYVSNLAFHKRGRRGAWSPGVCPSGYTAAWFQSQERATTSALCCPYRMTTCDTLGGCCSTVTTPTLAVTAPGRSATVTGGFMAIDWGFQVTWEPSDLDKFVPPSAPEQARMTAPLSSSRAATGPTHTRTQPSDDSQNLSTATEAGIGVGAAVVMLIIVGLIVSLCLRRRTKRLRQQSSSQARDFDNRKHGYSSQAVHEAEIRQPLQEADTQKPRFPPYRAELNSAWQGHELDLGMRYELEHRPYG